MPALLAMQSAVLAIADLSVRPSVTCWCFVQRNDDTIMRSSVSGSTMSLVSEGSSGHSQGITPSDGAKVRHPLSLAKI